MGDKLLVGLITTLLGIAVVFVILLVIIGMVKVIAFAARTVDAIINKLNEKKKTKEARGTALEESDVLPEVLPNTQDEELIAVIAAACTVMMGTAPDNIAVRTVRKIRRTAWADAGRRSQMM